MIYKLTGTILLGEAEIENLLNLKLDKFDQELTKFSKDKLKSTLKKAIDVLARIDKVYITFPEGKIKRTIELRLD